MSEDLRRVIGHGLKSCCPACGKGSLFEHLTKLNESCPECGLDFSIADTGDGPAFFVMFAVMIVLAPSAMLVELAFSPPLWLHMLIWPVFTIGLCAALLRPCKAVLFGLQWRNDAHEGRSDQ